MAVEGPISDSWLISFTICFGLGFIWLALFLWSRLYDVYVHYRRELWGEGEDQNPEIEPPTPHNPGICPICQDEPCWAVETNCAHQFCGDCLSELYQRTNSSCLQCPMCRTNVSLLFSVFNSQEIRETSQPSCHGALITQFVRRYNRRQNLSGAFRVLDRIRDIPVLLRHLFNELMQGELNHYMALRMGSSLIFSLFYIWLPIDMVPEMFFGILGLLDDLMVLLFLFFYVAHIYRLYVGRLDDQPAS